jgi:hypothetical protein
MAFGGSAVDAVELLLFGAAGQRCDGGRSGHDGLRNGIEVPGAHLTLVSRGRVAHPLGTELGLLQGDVRTHLRLAIAAGQLEHGVIQCVEAGERDELELLAHRHQFVLKARDGQIIELAFPVE